MELSAAVQQAIAEALPGMAAGELKTFIDTAQQTEKQLARTLTLLAERDKTINDLQATLNMHRNIAERECALEKQAEKIAQDGVDLHQRLLKHELAAARLEAEVARSELKGVRETTSLFLRNTTIHNNVLTQVPVPVEATPPNQYGNSGNPAHVQMHTATTATTQSHGLMPPSELNLAK